jgi:hypothetical protein
LKSQILGKIMGQSDDFEHPSPKTAEFWKQRVENKYQDMIAVKASHLAILLTVASDNSETPATLRAYARRVTDLAVHKGHDIVSLSIPEVVELGRLAFGGEPLIQEPEPLASVTNLIPKADEIPAPSLGSALNEYVAAAIIPLPFGSEAG